MTFLVVVSAHPIPHKAQHVPIPCDLTKGRVDADASPAITLSRGSDNPLIYYVSPVGNDSYSGLLPDPNPTFTDGPFLTPGKAAVAVSMIPLKTSPVRVEIRAGLYELDSTLFLGPAAGGNDPDSRVTWTKYATDTGPAVLSGGATIPPSAWTKTAQPGVWSAPLPLTAPARSRGFYVNGERRSLARVPAPAGPTRTESYSDMATLHYISALDGHKMACWGTPANASNEWGFVYNTSDPVDPNWADIPGMDVLVFGACPSGARYVLFNVYEALAPGSGTFYTNDTASMIYYAPLAGEDMATISTVVPVLDAVMSIAGDGCGGPVNFLTIDGLSMVHTTDGEVRETAYEASTGVISLSQSRDVTISNLVVQGADASGILLLGGLVRVTVDHCTVADVGGDGIGSVFGTSEDAYNVTLSNNIINGTGFIFLNQPAGIRSMGTAQGLYTITHNLVRDGPYGGIMAGWHAGVRRPAKPAPWQYIISGNVVEDQGQAILSDFGGIYISSDGYACEDTDSCYIPTLVEGNYVHRVYGYNYGGEGVYTDENVAGVSFIGNALGDVSGTSVYLHCGLNQTVSNNILFHAHAVAGSAFSTGLLGGCNTGGVSPQDAVISAVFQTNIFLVTAAGGTLFNLNGNMYPIANMSFSTNAYWAATPATPADALRWPVSSTAEGSFADWQAAGEDKGSIVADPQLVNVDSGDFTVPAGSPVLALGFRQLDTTWGPVGQAPHV